MLDYIKLQGGFLATFVLLLVVTILFWVLTNLTVFFTKLYPYSAKTVDVVIIIEDKPTQYTLTYNLQPDGTVTHLRFNDE